MFFSGKRSKLFCFLLATVLTGFASTSATAQVTTAPKQGLRENDPRLHALTNARVVSGPGKVFERATVIIRDGLIAEVGPDTRIPAGARVWDLAGKTVYYGFIDAYSRLGLPTSLQPEPLRPDFDPDDPDAKPKELPKEPVRGLHAWNPKVTPERNAADFVTLDRKASRQARELGFTSALIVSGRGIFRGTSALINLHDADAASATVAPNVAQHIAFDFNRGTDATYPNSLMGCIALVRQNFLDAGWFLAANEAYRRNPAKTERPEASASLAALSGSLQRKQPIVFEAEDELDLVRALRIAEEFKLKPILFGNGYEYRVRKSLGKTPIILPLTFPPVPEVEHPPTALEYGLDELQHWDQAPSNAARLVAAGFPIAFTAASLEKPEKEFWSRIRLSVRRGLSHDAALAALTTNPAEMFEVGDRLGTIAPGRIANLVVATGDLFTDDAARIITTWIDGRPYESDLAHQVDPRGKWEITLAGKTLPLVIDGELEKLGGQLGGEKIAVATDDNALLLVIPAKLIGGAEGTSVRLLGRIVGDTGSGTFQGADAAQVTWTAKRTGPHERKPPEPSPIDRALDLPETFPAGAYGRSAEPEQPAAILVRGATVWTSGPQGVVEGADLLVSGGKITSIGKGLAPPARAVVIEGKDLHVTPGIIDCHSHTAISGGVNEATHAITTEVRIGDVLDATDIALYRELAGGVTSALILHGSANPMGGQSEVIKFRWGASPEQLKFAEAMPGVKFALGENVKQSNWGDQFTKRYPQTRMGVEQIMRDRFNAAREYGSKRTDGLPPRRDLQLEALGEVLNGKRLIHCHSYRQDEISAFLRLTSEFKIRVATLQHILEGYKVADEIAQAGAGASSFADWWAYKFEVYDAIPENAAIMHAQGVLTSVNSDSNDLARRLNTEAAKSMKWGGLSAEEALKLVTINPAKQLRIENKVGSLESGKDADFVIWSGNPLSNYSRVNQTWIDGRKYFDRAEDLEARKAMAAQREALVQKALPERLKELEKKAEKTEASEMEKKQDDQPQKTPPRHLHNRHRELQGLYGSGVDRHTCQEEAE